MRLATAALGFLVAVVAVLGTWQVVTARASQRAEVQAAERNAAHLASSALGGALASQLQLLSNLASDTGVASIFTKETPSQLAEVAGTLHTIYPAFASFDIIGG